MTRYLYLRSIRKDMPMYTIEERDGKIYAQINAAQARITSLPDFSDNIFEFLDRNRGKLVVFDAEDFPIDDTSKSRIDTLASLLPEHPNLRLRMPERFAQRFKDYFGEKFVLTSEGYSLN